MAESLCWNKSFLVITSPVYVIFQTFRVLTVRKISEQNLMLTFGKSVRIQSYFGLHFPAFGLNMERYGVSLHIQSKCGKIRTRITPNTDTFYAVEMVFKNIKQYLELMLQKKLKKYWWLGEMKIHPVIVFF